MHSTELEKNKKVNGRKKFSFWEFYENYGVLLVFVMEVILFTAISPVFLKPTNILNVLRQISITGILAVGMTFVIITGGIDLSVGAIIALVTVLVAGTQHFGMIPSIFIGLGTGLGIGLLNGIGVAYGRLQAFIMTLGTTSIATGLAFIYSKGLPIMVNGPFINIGNGSVGKVPLPVIYFAVILIAGHMILRYTTFGRYVYSMGSNEEATRLSGVDVSKHKLIVYAISGLLAAVAGIIYTSQLGIGTAIAGKGYELNAIAAVVVGGASLFGGVGTMGGTFLGAAIIGALGNIMNLTGVNPFIQTFLTGVIIILAVLIRRKR